jgi:hypothetical protein
MSQQGTSITEGAAKTDAAILSGLGRIWSGAMLNWAATHPEGVIAQTMQNKSALKGGDPLTKVLQQHLGK